VVCGGAYLARARPAPARADVPAIIPTPKSLKITGGRLRIAPANRVLHEGALLAPLARVLAVSVRRRPAQATRRGGTEAPAARAADDPRATCVGETYEEVTPTAKAAKADTGRPGSSGAHPADWANASSSGSQQ